MDYASWYLNNAHKYLTPEISFESETEIHEVFYDPIGVSAVIIPWNFPIANLIQGSIQSLLAGKKFIKAIVELGGSAAGIIFEDADLDQAVENVVFNRLFNQGQCCDALKRLIVHESIYDEVVQKISDAFKSKKIGNSEDLSTEIGPLVAKRQVETLISQVEDAKNKGANIVTGGNSLESTLGGAYFEPTLITNIAYDMKIWTEEVFGPVLPVVKFKTEQEAVALANDTIYGLGAYVYTQNTELAQRVAKQIKTGMVSINGTSYLQPSNPFGGYKSSDLGRQHGKYGFGEVTQVKVVARTK